MKYRKIALIEAEQFNGSDEMIKKYHIEFDDAYMCPFRIETPDGWLGVNTYDWIVTLVNGKHLVISDDAFKKTYEEVSEGELKGLHLKKAMAHMINPKQHDCPYCNRRRNFPTLFSDKDYAEVRIVMNDILFIHQYPKPDTTIKIKYCPMCGRNLEE